MTPLIFGLDSQAWLTVALVSGYAAALVAMLWRLPHCPCCSKKNPVNRRHM